MAPAKSQAGKAKKPSVKTSEDRVSKRPARGFHQFRDGMLNVRSKGGEKELAKSNQDSPLLRLPPEIRQYIWQYALGGHDLRYSALFDAIGKITRRQMVPPVVEQKHGLDLLRTCRQIYSETALLPYKLNTFTTYETWFRSALKHLKSFQLAQIEEIHLEATSSSGINLFYGHTSVRARKTRFDFLPGLKRIQVLVFRPQRGLPSFEEAAKKNSLRQLESLFEGRDVKITFREMECTWFESQKNWHYHALRSLAE